MQEVDVNSRDADGATVAEILTCIGCWSHQLTPIGFALKLCPPLRRVSDPRILKCSLY